MTIEGKKFLEGYKKGTVLLETLQIVYNKNHITKEEFIKATGVEPGEETKNEIPLENRLSALEEALLDIME